MPTAAPADLVVNERRAASLKDSCRKLLTQIAVSAHGPTLKLLAIIGALEESDGTLGGLRFESVCRLGPIARAGDWSERGT